MPDRRVVLGVIGRAAKVTWDEHVGRGTLPTQVSYGDADRARGSMHSYASLGKPNPEGVVGFFWARRLCDRWAIVGIPEAWGRGVRVAGGRIQPAP